MSVILKKINRLKPKIIKGVSNTLQGYIFGCMMGLFTGNKEPSIRSVHQSGKDVAKICAIYSTAETVIEAIRKNDDFYTRALSGILTGSLCTKDKFLSTSNLFGTFSLGLYSGLSK